MIQIPFKKQIYLIDDVSQGSCSKIIAQIHDMGAHDREMVSYIESIGGQYTPANIELYINSSGGSIYDALGLYDTIISSYTPITTIVTGVAMSAAGLIALAGDTRYCTKNSIFMIHSLVGESFGKIGDITQNTKELSKLQKRLDELIVERTNITMKRMEEIHREKLDWYIDTSKAINLGIVQDLW